VQERKATRRRDVEGDHTRAAIRDARRKVEELEKEISTLEHGIAELTKQLEDPELYTTSEGTKKSVVAGKELEALRRKLDGALERWTAETEKLEDVQEQRT
jgi:predicted  nucleic acid-binding Zn-ribbon protein